MHPGDSFTIFIIELDDLSKAQLEICNFYWDLINWTILLASFSDEGTDPCLWHLSHVL